MERGEIWIIKAFGFVYLWYIGMIFYFCFFIEKRLFTENF